jgi:nucleoside-diphosphate kinase
VGDIIGRFETKGYKLVALKTRMATAELLDQHYNELVDKPFFPKLKEYMLSGPVSWDLCSRWSF